VRDFPTKLFRLKSSSRRSSRRNRAFGREYAAVAVYRRKDAGIKRQIRIAAEREEYESYHGRMSEKWLKRLAQLGTDEHKPFLETAPYLIVVFRINSVTENSRNRADLLFAGIGRHRRRNAARGFAQCGIGDADAYAQPDEIFAGNLTAPENGNSVCFNSGRLSGGGRESSRHQKKTAR
jgi:hypothetical protein